MSEPSYRLTRYSQLQPQRVDWLWPGRLPCGKVVLLDGDPDVGKSTVMVDVAARLSAGLMLPDGYLPETAATTLMLRGEDGALDTVLPRLLAAGGDPERFVELSGIPEGHNGSTTWRMPELPTDLDVLEAVIRSEHVRLVIVDVLMVFLSDRVNAHKDQHVRRALGPLSLMAERTGVCIVALRHLNKIPGVSALYRGGGSIGLIGAARTGLLAGYDPDVNGRRLLAVSKCNLAARAETLAYRIVSADRHGVGRIEWDGASERTAADLVLLAARDSDEQARLDEALAVLFVILSDGPRPARDVTREAHQAGLSDFMLRKAKETAGVLTRREGGGTHAGRWVWELPNPDALLDDDGL